MPSNENGNKRYFDLIIKKNTNNNFHNIFEYIYKKIYLFKFNIYIYIIFNFLKKVNSTFIFSKP